MRNIVFGVLSIVFFVFLWAPLPVFAEGVESLAEDTGETSHGAVARGTAEKD